MVRSVSIGASICAERRFRNWMSPVLSATLAVSLSAVAVAEEAAPDVAARPASASWPQVIEAERNLFIPEGVEYDAAGRRFLLGSLREGTVFALAADGKLTPAFQDPELRSSVGIEVDAKGGRLLVANSDASVFTTNGPGQAKLSVFELASGKRLATVDLGAALGASAEEAKFFANDVTVDAAGIVYVTDTRAATIYRVDGEYRASVLRRFDAAKELAPNGLVAHPDGYLLVAGGSKLYKVPVAAPDQATPVSLPTEIAGADGVVWLPDGRLAIVANQQNRVVAFTSPDGWKTAELAGVAKYEVMASTAAVVGDQLYVVHPHFRDEGKPSVERVRFE